jgi:hypothetical protein
MDDAASAARLGAMSGLTRLVAQALTIKSNPSPVNVAKYRMCGSGAGRKIGLYTDQHAKP